MMIQLGRGQKLIFYISRTLDASQQMKPLFSCQKLYTDCLGHVNRPCEQLRWNSNQNEFSQIEYYRNIVCVNAATERRKM